MKAERVPNAPNEPSNDTLSLVNADKTEVGESDKFYNNRSSFYAWGVTMLLLLGRIAFGWGRKSLPYVYGFKGEGLQRGNPDFEILTALPGLDSYYGLLVGLAYTLPFSFGSIFVSLLPPGFNRKKLITAVSILAGLGMFLTGSIDSLAVLIVARVIHSLCNSISNPLFFSMAGDYFPKSRRGTANAVLQSANNIGFAISSMSILIVQSSGWRALY